MRTPGTLGLKKLPVEKVWAQIICIDFLIELDHSSKSHFFGFLCLNQICVLVQILKSIFYHGINY